jgi:hypothetical protein
MTSIGFPIPYPSASLWGKATKEPLFHSFHRQQVEEQHSSEDEEEKNRRRDETKRLTHGGKRQQYGYRHYAMSQGLGRLLKGFLRVRMFG